jgi:hypothetical protein
MINELESFWQLVAKNNQITLEAQADSLRRSVVLLK